MFLYYFCTNKDRNMETINEYKFPLLSVIKYAKGWFKRSDSIWYDMALCLWDNGHGYGPYFGYNESSKKTPQEECFRERMNICENIICKLRPSLVNKQFRLSEITKHISPQESWKVGYYTMQSDSIWGNKNGYPEWEYWEAVLRAHLSEICIMTCNELGYTNEELHNLLEGINIPELKKEEA